MKTNLKILLCGIVLLISISIPFVVAEKSTGVEYKFGGFLLNPIDGNSYLAKMKEGYSGDWLFTLPYTAGEKKGAFLFEFYLFLGHIARCMSLQLPVMFHLARFFSTLIFFVTLINFLKRTIDTPENRFLQVVLLTCFGSGTGWLLSGFGVMTSDLWVAEAFPFLAAFSNPHFILGMSCFLLILSKIDARKLPDLVLIWGLGIILAIIMPFAAVLAGIIFTGREIWRWFEDRKINIFPALAILSGGGFVTIFQYLQTIKDPFLALWNSQNFTPSPPLWDLCAAFSPALIFALIGIVDIVRKKQLTPGNKITLIWLAVTLIAVAVPFSLQRRFLFGMYIPVSIFAVDGLWVAAKGLQKKFRFLFFVVFAFSLLTNTLVLFSGVNQVRAGNSNLVLEKDYITAFDWIEENTNRQDIILTSPTIGNYLPAYTGRQVLYGHPFETVNAMDMEKTINRFYMNNQDFQNQKKFLEYYEVKWVIFGTRELELGTPAILEDLQEVFKNNSLKIYKAYGKP